MLFAPAIVSAYVTYGIVSTNKAISTKFSRKPVARDYVAGAILGLAFGSYYVVTGNRIDEDL